MSGSRSVLVYALALGAMVAVNDVQAQAVPPARPPAALQAGPGRIGGSVTGPAGEPLPAAAITIRSAADSSVVGGSMSAKDGRFRIEGIPVGSYTVRVSQLGYNSVVKQVTIGAASPAVDLGAVKLDIAAVQVEGIEAQAARSPVVMEVDRTVYNTKEMPAAAAGKAVDVLRNIPELEVDFNNKVTLRGNQVVALHLNGRPAPLRGEALANFLAQLPGDRIAKVEVMPNPTAKHDPEGMGGIVNIVLKDDLDLGLSGNASLNGNSRGNRGLSGRLNYQKGKFTLFTGGSFSLNDFDNSTYDLRENLLAHPITFLEQSANNQNGGNSRFMDGTAELRVGKQATVWTSFWGFVGGNDSEALTAYRIFDEALAEVDRYDRDTENDGSHGNMDVTLGFKQVFTPNRHEFTVDVRRSAGGNENLTRALKYQMLNGVPIEDPAELTLNETEADNGTITLQADYFRPLGPKGKIDIGFRTMVRDETNDFRLDVFADETGGAPMSTQRSGYAYEETFHSLYMTAGQTKGKLSGQIGLRGELAQTTFALPLTGYSDDNHYRSIFPSANLAYDFGKGRTARLSYSKRIGRPWPNLLNPDVPSSDPLNRQVGNPDLEPNYTHSVSLDLSKVGTKGTLRVAPYFRRTVNNWDNFKTVDSLGVSTVHWLNMSSIMSYGTNLTASLRPLGRVSGSVSVGLYRDVRDASNIDDAYSRDDFRWSAGGNGNFKLSKTLNASGNVRYSPPYTVLQGKMSGNWHTNVGFRQQLWNNKGSVSAFINDPFQMYNNRMVTTDRTHNQTSRTSMKQRQVSLSMTWNFGKPPEQKSRRSSDEGGAPTSVIR